MQRSSVLTLTIVVLIIVWGIALVAIAPQLESVASAIATLPPSIPLAAAVLVSVGTYVLWRKTLRPAPPKPQDGSAQDFRPLDTVFDGVAGKLLFWTITAAIVIMANYLFIPTPEHVKYGYAFCFSTNPPGEASRVFVPPRRLVEVWNLGPSHNVKISSADFRNPKDENVPRPPNNQSGKFTTDKGYFDVEPDGEGVRILVQVANDRDDFSKVRDITNCT